VGLFDEKIKGKKSRDKLFCSATRGKITKYQWGLNIAAWCAVNLYKIGRIC
jgi:hypothetical protein